MNEGTVNSIDGWLAGGTDGTNLASVAYSHKIIGNINAIGLLTMFCECLYDGLTFRLSVKIYSFHFLQNTLTQTVVLCIHGPVLSWQLSSFSCT